MEKEKKKEEEKKRKGEERKLGNSYVFLCQGPVGQEKS